MKETSAGVVLFRRSGGRVKFLLLHYPSGHWDFVKGKMEPGETARETALRETEEETGITDVRFLDGFEEQISYEFEHMGENIIKKVVLFLAETRTKSIKISHEHQGYLWCEYKKAEEKTTFDNAKRVLKMAAVQVTADAGPRAQD
ncbi:MAG: NUDIX domain-containing protein [Nitrosopumilus sp. B06]|nr:MAG: NUDIX domain-containing protein [Nitrosopumilus sp. D6]RNJ78747.1 MAG: NUDIX domain-containing protein [Nitrosopumilus sp. B06]